MFQGSCASTWILVLRKDYLHQEESRFIPSRLEPETRPINLLLHCIISLMREQRQFTVLFMVNWQEYTCILLNLCDRIT